MFDAIKRLLGEITAVERWFGDRAFIQVDADMDANGAPCYQAWTMFKSDKDRIKPVGSFGCDRISAVRSLIELVDSMPNYYWQDED